MILIILLILNLSLCYSYFNFRSSLIPKQSHEYMCNQNLQLFSKNEVDGNKSGWSGEQSYLKAEERLQKVISRAGIASRRQAETIIESGKVTVNGKLINTLGCKVNPKKDVITVNGQKIAIPDIDKKYWIIVNKPKQVLTTMSDDKKRDTIADLVPQAKDLRLLPVGRLERNTAGLVIMTNDNGWLHPLTHPSFEHNQKFQLILKGIPTLDNIELLTKNGIDVNGGFILKILNAQVIDVDEKEKMTLIEITIKQTCPDLMLKIASVLQCKLDSVKRTEFGPLKLKGVRKGSWRELTTSELMKLKKSCKEVENKNQDIRLKKIVHKKNRSKFNRTKN